MRWLLPVLSMLLAAAPAQAEEVDASDRVFVELTTARTARYVGEVVPIGVRLGYDAAWFDAQAVPLFRREVDVALHLRVPWLDGRPGAPALRALEVAPERDPLAVSVAVNDALLRMRRLDDEARDGRTYRVLQLVRPYVVEAPGELLLEAPRVRFAYATEFEEGFLDERVPLDRRAANEEGAPLALRVVVLPEAGRPPSFVDAVGAFRITARADRREVAPGKPFRLTLSIRGEGNLARLTPPAGELFEGFHVYGVIDDRKRPVRSVVYELAPLSAAVSRVPAIPFAWFDPTPPVGYRVARTKAIALRVPGAPVAPATPKAEGVAPAPEGSDDGVLPDGMPGWVPALLALFLLATVGALAWALHLRRRLRASGNGLDAARAARIRSAREDLETGLDGAAGSAEPSLRGYLAAQLGCAPAALVSPELQVRLVEAGIPPALAARVAAYLEKALAARYGAPPEAAPARPAASLVDELHAAFERARG